MADVKPLVRHSSGYPADLGSDTLVAEELKATVRGVNAGGGRVQNVGAPTSATDAATKAYADSIASGLYVKQPARVATTANLNVSSPGATIDGVALVVNDRVLVKNQTTKNQNGIYLWKGSAVAMVRASDTLTSGVALMVNEGTAQKDTQWVLTTDGAITPGTTAIEFTQFRTLADLLPGRSIDITGNTVSLKTGGGLTSTGDVAVDPGNGIEISGGKVAAKPKTNGGLAVDSGGLYAAAGAGISVGAGIAVALKANSGLDTTGGLGVGAGSGLQTAGGVTSVKADAGVVVGAGGVGVKADKGIAVSAAGVAVKPDQTKGIDVHGTDGVQIKVGSGLDFDVEGNLRVRTTIVQSTGSALVVSGEAISANRAVCVGAAGVLTAQSGTAGRGDVIGVVTGAYPSGDNPVVYYAGLVPSFVSGLANGQAGYLGPTGALQAASPATGRIVRVGFQTAAGFIVAIQDYGER